MTFSISYNTTGNESKTLQGNISFSYGEGSDWQNRKASTVTANIRVMITDYWHTFTTGTSKMVADNNDPDFGRELAIWRALERIAPTGQKSSVNIPVGENGETATVTARELRIAVWEAWRTRRGDGEIAPVKDSTRKAWREYRAWVREHGRGQQNQLAQTA